MTDTYDIVTIGSGHNGLVAAAYLAAGGKSVLVLERNAWFGGGVVTRELTLPGFKHDQHSMAHIFIQGNPLLKNDELGLKAKYGLQYVYPDMPFISVFEDGETLSIYRDRERTRADIARFSEKDADAFMRLAEQAAQYVPMLAASFYSPPAPMGAGYAMMDQSIEGREFMRYMGMSCYDLICDYFENERVRVHFTRLIGENLTGPEERGTGIGLFVFLGFTEAYGFGCPIGGSGALTNALIRCIEDHGGTVLANQDVTKVIVSGGKAAGVELATGERYMAKDAVIGAIHPHVLPDMVAGLDAGVAARAKRVQLSENCCITIQAALNEPLKFKAGAHVNDGYMIELVPDSMDAMRRYFDQLRYGGIPDRSMLGIGSLTQFDPSRAPAGKATMQMWDYVPYEHPQGGHAAWDRLKTAHVETMIERAAPWIENLNHDNILAYHSDSPVDMERTSPSFRHGDIHGVAPLAYQSGAHRPTPDLGQNTVPGIDGLYLVGPFQYPGGGVFGAGRGTAMRMFDDLGMDFDRIGG